jgi:hypothetical protein
VPARPALGPQSQTTQWQVQVVVYDQDPFRGQILFFAQAPNGPAAAIHISLWLGQQYGTAVDLGLSDVGLGILVSAEGQTMGLSEGVHDPKADVVPVRGMVWARISKPNDECPVRC